jgi:hypothetical protein
LTGGDGREYKHLMELGNGRECTLGSAYRRDYDRRIQRTEGVEQSPSQVPALPPPYLSPADEFGRHFLRCFICHVGDRYTEDHYCEDGRDLIVAMLDEIVERDFQANKIAESRLVT